MGFIFRPVQTEEQEEIRKVKSHQHGFRIVIWLAANEKLKP
jgi:hypothetical protein